MNKTIASIFEKLNQLDPDLLEQLCKEYIEFKKRERAKFDDARQDRAQGR